MKLFLAINLLAASAVWAADPVPMDVKTGEWEHTVTVQMTGMPQAAAGAKQMPQLTPEQLAQIPADQRARIQAMMAQGANMMSGKPTTTTSKNCIKKEDLAKMMPNATRDQSCKATIVSSSRTKQELKMDCDSNGNKETGTVTVEALSSDSTKFSMQMSGTQNGQPMSMTVNGTSKWLGATCTESK